jgi:hypothetical protein
MSKVEFDDLSSKEGGVLSALWRAILKENNFIYAIDIMVNKYVRKTDILEGRSVNVKRKTRSSLINNIAAGEMTFKTFLDLLFNFLSVRKITITIMLTHANNDKSIHTIDINNNDYNLEEEVKVEDKNKSNTG